MKVKQLFMNEVTDQAVEELDCYGYCLDEAIVRFMQGKFDEAAAYHENIARLLRELESLKSRSEAKVLQ